MIKKWLQGVVDRATDPDSPLKGPSLYQKVMALDTVPFYGLLIGLYLISVILGSIIFGDYKWITNVFVGGFIGMMVGNRLFPTKTDDRDEE